MSERRQMVTSFVHEQEEETRRAAAASQAKQGQWMNWHNVEKRKISWRELWAMDANHIKFIVGATYDVLPTLQNLSQWVGEHESCKICLGHLNIICLGVKLA